MIYDFEEEQPAAEDLEAVKEHAQVRLRSCWNRFGWTVAGFVLSCALVFPFMAGEPLHNRWEPFAKYLVFLCMGMWLLIVLYGGLVWSAWKCLHDVSKDLKNLATRQP
jgi:hypothetical protein